MEASIALLLELLLELEVNVSVSVWVTLPPLAALLLHVTNVFNFDVVVVVDVVVEAAGGGGCGTDTIIKGEAGLTLDGCTLVLVVEAVAVAEATVDVGEVA